MKVIYKYTLAAGVNVIHLPVGTRFLSIEMQGAYICMWAEVPMSQPMITRPATITAFSTGDEVPSNLMYIDSVQEYEYVWHFYHD